METHRYDDMIESLKSITLLNKELSVDEQQLLSIGYQNTIRARRVSLRAVAKTEQKELMMKRNEKQLS